MPDVSADIINAIATHLRSGGTRLEADLLLARLIEELQVPQREADTQKRIDDAVTAARVPVAASEA